MIINKEILNKVKKITIEKFPARRAELYVEKDNDFHGYIECFDEQVEGELPIFTADFEITEKIDYDSQEFQNSDIYKVVSAMLATDYKRNVTTLVRVRSIYARTHFDHNNKLKKICMDVYFNERFRYEFADGYYGYKDCNIEFPDATEDGSMYIYTTDGKEDRYKILVNENRSYYDVKTGKDIHWTFEVKMEKLLKLRTPGVNDMDIIGDFMVYECDCPALDGIQTFTLHGVNWLIGMDHDEYAEGELLKLKYWADEKFLKEFVTIYTENFSRYDSKKLFMLRKNEENRLSIVHEGLYWDEDDNGNPFLTREEPPIREYW